MKGESKMEKPVIFVLFSCDEWKTSSSMRFITATLSLETLFCVVKAEILNDNMNYSRGKDGLSAEEQAALFTSDVDEEGIDFALDLLEYGYVEGVEDGEVI